MKHGSRTGKKDINGKDICVGDNVKMDETFYLVQYGNFNFLGVDRIGYFIQSSWTHEGQKTQRPLTNNSVEIIPKT